MRLTQFGYLFNIRKAIATRHTPDEETKMNSMTEEQQVAYQQLLKKRSETLRKTATESAKK